MLPFLARSLILIAAAIGFAAFSRRRGQPSIGRSRESRKALGGEGAQPRSRGSDRRSFRQPEAGAAEPAASASFSGGSAAQRGSAVSADHGSEGASEGVVPRESSPAVFLSGVVAAPLPGSPETPGAPGSVAPSPSSPDDRSPSEASSGAPAEAAAYGKADIPAPPGPLDAPRGGRPDNLTLISGIGPSIERLLFENGIFHFDQIAGWSDEEARRIDALTGFSGRVARENWQPQARRFMAARLV